MVVFRADPCGIICVLITYAAVFYADYVVVRQLVIPTMSSSLWGAFNIVAFNLVVFLMVVAHSRAVFSDPGIVPLPKTSLDFSDIHSGKKIDKKNGWTVCMKCEAYRPPRAHHCRICRRCIRRMDHHCPWINNCVGELNQKFFLQFLFYVGVSSLYAISLVVLVWVLDPKAKSVESRHARVMHSIILTVESVLFGLFVIAIGCDQMYAIFSDETAVEHVKKAGPYRQQRPKWLLLTEVFGKGPVYNWLCPFSATHVLPEPAEDYTV